MYVLSAYDFDFKRAHRDHSYTFELASFHLVRVSVVVSPTSSSSYLHFLFHFILRTHRVNIKIIYRSPICVTTCIIQPIRVHHYVKHGIVVAAACIVFVLLCFFAWWYVIGTSTEPWNADLKWNLNFIRFNM